MDDDYLKLYEAMSDRITDLYKCYRVLNDAHSKTAISLAKLESQVGTTSSIVKWLISPVALVSLLIQVLRIFKVIP